MGEKGSGGMEREQVEETTGSRETTMETVRAERTKTRTQARSTHPHSCKHAEAHSNVTATASDLATASTAHDRRPRGPGVQALAIRLLLPGAEDARALLLAQAAQHAVELVAAGGPRLAAGRRRGGHGAMRRRGARRGATRRARAQRGAAEPSVAHTGWARS